MKNLDAIDKTLTCRACGVPLSNPVLNLGQSPISNAYPRIDWNGEEEFYPLQLYVCPECHFTQLGTALSPESHFHNNYAYFSKYSTTWLSHCESFVNEAIERFSLGPGTRVLEIGSNDGSLLQYFQMHGLDVLGIDPSANVAEFANKKGIPTEVMFFGASTARSMQLKGFSAELLVANNVMAHVPDPNDFVAGLTLLMKGDSVLAVEFPHLLNLLKEGLFDTIYHEHYSYLSLLALTELFARHGLRIFDVEQLSTHGGSLRVYACRNEATHSEFEAPARWIDQERAYGLDRFDSYYEFAKRVANWKVAFVDSLTRQKNAGKRLAAYGAPAKATTLLNFAEVGPDLIEFTVDRNPQKQQRMIPGRHIPIYAPDVISERKPDVIIVLAWNIKNEILADLDYAREWGCQFLIPFPQPVLVP